MKYPELNVQNLGGGLFRHPSGDVGSWREFAILLFHETARLNHRIALLTNLYLHAAKKG